MESKRGRDCLSKSQVVPFFLEDYLFLNDHELQPLDSFLNGSLFRCGQSVNNINHKQRMAQLLENVTDACA